jgi:chromosome segregation ATPase
VKQDLEKEILTLSHDVEKTLTELERASERARAREAVIAHHEGAYRRLQDDVESARQALVAAAGRIDEATRRPID